MQTYHFEITDTYGGEANYCWVNRYKLEAKTLLGALQKLSRRTGYHWRKTYDTRWDSKRSPVCVFLIDDEHSIDAYEFVDITNIGD